MNFDHISFDGHILVSNGYYSSFVNEFFTREFKTSEGSYLLSDKSKYETVAVVE